jgi:hypothetical protein
MRVATVLGLAALFGLSAASAVPSTVQVLTEETFASSVGAGGKWFVKFYAPVR